MLTDYTGRKEDIMKYTMANENNYYKNLICAEIYDEQEYRQFYIGYQSKFYDENDNEYDGIQIISILQIQDEEEFSNTNIEHWVGDTTYDVVIQGNYIIWIR